MNYNQNAYQDRLIKLTPEERVAYLDAEASAILGENPTHRPIKGISLESLSRDFLEQHIVEIWD